jgi:predicted PilT family ATPase
MQVQIVVAIQIYLLTFHLPQALRKNTKILYKKMSSEKLYVPQRFHAAIIGRGGKSISHLQSEYHCKVAVPKPHESSSLVVVSAKDAQNCHRVVEEIEKIIGFKVIFFILCVF